MTKQATIATADEVKQLSSNNAKTTLDEESVAANHYALDRTAITALEQWMAEVNANDSAAQRGIYNARLPRSSPAQPVITPETLNVPRVLSTNQPAKDGYVGNKTSEMYAAGGNNSNFHLSQFIEPKLREGSDTQSRVSSDAGAPWIPSGNLHAVRPAGREYTPQSQAILDSLGGPNATKMDWALVRALVRNGTAKEEYWRPSGDEGKTKVLVPLTRNDGSVDTLVLGSVWAFWWWNNNYFENLDLRVGSTPAQESIRTTQENQANHNGVMAVREALANTVLGVATAPVLTETALGAGISWLVRATPIRVALVTFGGSNGVMEAKSGYDAEQRGDRAAAFQHYEKAFWSSVLAISAAWPRPAAHEPIQSNKGSESSPRTPIAPQRARTEHLTARAEEFEAVLDPIARNHRTTAVLETTNGSTIIGGGVRDLSPAQRALQQPGEILSRLPGEHAEITVLQEAAARGLRPKAISTTKDFCLECRIALEETGAIITGPRTAIWE